MLKLPLRLAATLSTLLWFSLLALPCGAQPAASPDAQPTVVLGTSVVALAGPWRFAPGDSPTSHGAPLWAQPGFDDSHWDTMDLTPPRGSVDVQGMSQGFTPGWTRRGYPNLRRYAWYRLRIHLRSHGQPLWLDIPTNVDDAYQVFADGQYLGEFGDFEPTRVLPHYGLPTIFKLPSPAPSTDRSDHPDPSIEIAIRFFMTDVSPLRWPDAGGLHSPPLVGLASTIFPIRANQSSQIFNIRIGGLLAIFLNLLALPFAVWALWTNRRDRTWLWLALAIAAALATQTLRVASNDWRSAPMWLGELLTIAFLNHLIVLFWILFWQHWFSLEHKRWIARTALPLTAANVIVSLVFESPTAGFTFASLKWLSFCNAASIALSVATGILLALLLGEGFRKDRTAALAATLPILLLEYSSFYVPMLAIFSVPPALMIHGFGFTYDSLTEFLMLLSVGALATRRFISGREIEARERESAERDLDQARQLQQGVLVPGSSTVGNFAIDVVYRPATQVGGDFFQIIPLASDGVLVAIGDVSGKGLPAAMTVSLLVGAMRLAAEASSSPAAILASLNRALHGSNPSGFTTALILHMHSNGGCTASSAGHLAPYRNGVEIGTECGLPLGVAAQIEYAETIFDLSPGDQLTLITDGVLEARNPATGELFGFDRTAAISIHSAEAIAQAAQAFGQDDDITVLTLSFIPVEAAHA